MKENIVTVWPRAANRFPSWSTKMSTPPGLRCGSGRDEENKPMRMASRERLRSATLAFFTESGEEPIRQSACDKPEIWRER